jgi:hypothetical protein
MKKITVFVSAAILLAAFITVTAFKTPPPRPSANGQGTLTVGDQTRHFSFHANTMPNNSVQGSGVLTYTANGLKIHFDINCLSVTGNTATMSGVITKDDEAERVGWQIRFKVQDNGEGANANPDMMSLMQLSPALPACNVPFGITLNPIEGGNIQVK